jgi:hypothetical protein
MAVVESKPTPTETNGAADGGGEDQDEQGDEGGKVLSKKEKERLKKEKEKVHLARFGLFDGICLYILSYRLRKRLRLPRKRRQPRLATMKQQLHSTQSPNQVLQSLL